MPAGKVGGSTHLGIVYSLLPRRVGVEVAPHVLNLHLNIILCASLCALYQPKS